MLAYFVLTYTCGNILLNLKYYNIKYNSYCIACVHAISCTIMSIEHLFSYHIDYFNQNSTTENLIICNSLAYFMVDIINCIVRMINSILNSSYYRRYFY